MVEEDTEFITFDGVTISKSEFRDDIINKYIQANLDGLTKITDFTIGSEAYHLADVMASFILEHRELIDMNYRMSMIHTCEGEFLDNFGDMVGVHRYGSSASTGEVTFTRLSNDTSPAIVIADGTQVSTDDAISFVVDNDGEDLILESGATSITAPVICEQDGAYTNVLAHTIVLVMGDLGKLVSVTNANDFNGGQDIEEDDDYRARILLAPYEFPVGSLGWYENTSLLAQHIEEIDGKMTDVKSVHDVKAEKGEIISDADVTIIFNPNDWTSTVVREDINQFNEDNAIESTVTATMTRARADLVDLFQMKEYNLVGITQDFHLAEKVDVLQGDDYLFALLLENNYTISMVKSNVVKKIQEFNSNAMISNEFNPNGLASLIENEVAGVNTCRIVQYDPSDESYIEIVEPTLMNDSEVYQVDLTNINDRIVALRFNIDIDVGGE